MPFIHLSRADNSIPWGFRLHGGKDFGAPLSVMRINPGSQAAKCGLEIGDVILKINASSAIDLKHKDAQDLIAKGGNSIELVISRGEEINVQSPSVAEGGSTTAYRDVTSPMSPTSAYSPKPSSESPSGSHSYYGQSVAKLTNDTASLNINQTYETNNRPKWEPLARGVAVPPATGYNPSKEDTKKYVPSETCKLVKDMESGNGAAYSPRTGAERRPATTQSKLIDYLEKKEVPANQSSSNVRSPGSSSVPSYRSPASGTSRAPATGAWNARSPASSTVNRPGGASSPSSVGADRKHDTKKTHLQEALSMPQYAGGVLPICNVDNIPVKGPYVTAVNKIWCQEHFVCSNPSCRRSLVDSGFVEEEGQLFCKEDYELYFAPRCAKCDKPIIGDTVKALQRAFHPNCFSCGHCKQPIMGGVFHLQQGEPYCEKDYAALFQSKCYGCQFAIELGDTWIEALGQNWHAECFNCTTCHVNLEGQGFVNRGGRPYCKEHARV